MFEKLIVAQLAEIFPAFLNQDVSWLCSQEPTVGFCIVTT